MANSKQKGARAEREVAKILRDHGFADARRTAQYCGNTGDAADVDGLPGFHIEVKIRDKDGHLAIDKWWDEQALPEAEKAQKIPLLVFRKDYQKWRVCMDFETFLEVVKDYVPF